MFSSTYTILKNGKAVGKMRSNPWKSETIGILFDEKILFKKHSIFNSKTHIHSFSKNNVLGVIRDKSFNSTSLINKKDGGKLKFKTKHGLWKNNFILKSNNSSEATFKGHEMSGVIKSSDDLDEIEILSGLYLCNHYRDKALLIIVIVITIIISS